ncbi:MAG: hypothetical protein QOD30_1586 [Actinomycetota bacterium]|nr:hypothetical protein [Actinomycetota bacterium]
MTTTAWIVLAVAAVVAVADWVAVWRRPAPVENVLKPLVLVALIAMALALHPTDDATRAWFVVALVLSLAGDVFLLPDVDRFVPGLASFLLAHVAYVVGFAVGGRGDQSLVPLIFVLAGLGLSAQEVVRAVARSDRSLLGPVVVYTAVISMMVAASYWHGEVMGIGGAVVFAMSDSILARDRFVRARRWMPLAVMVTYHVAQALLVVSLVR